MSMGQQHLAALQETMPTRAFGIRLEPRAEAFPHNAEVYDGMAEEWTISTLKQYAESNFAGFNKLLEERDKRREEHNAAQDAALRAAMSAAREAIDKASIANDDRFRSIPELRASLNDVGRVSMPRVETESLIRSLADKLEQAVKGLDAKFDTRLSALDEKYNTKIDTIDSKFGSLSVTRGEMLNVVTNRVLAIESENKGIVKNKTAIIVTGGFVISVFLFLFALYSFVSNNHQIAADALSTVQRDSHGVPR